MILRKMRLDRFKNNRVWLHATKRLLSSLPTDPELDSSYLLNPNNISEIRQNIENRKGVGDIELVHALKNKLEEAKHDDKLYNSLERELLNEMLKLPNRTHPEVSGYQNEPKLLKEVGSKRISDDLKDFQEITKRLKLVRTDQLGSLCGSKSYYLLGEMAELEQALINYVVRKLRKSKFQLVSVPDILPRDLIEACGMSTRGARTQVYTLDGADLCLSGTSEMALAGFLANQNLPASTLPLKLAAISRCYRAETSNLVEERGIYRVHEFTKVEMFVASHPHTSDQTLEEIREIQEELFGALALHFRVLDMPPHELGAPAYRKYDVEAWLAGRGSYGEISSCSNCWDYQARRLGIRVEGGSFVHTLNGTACAVPRLLIALVENNQNANGTIGVPEVLREFMGGKSLIGKQKRIPELKLIKHKI